MAPTTSSAGGPNRDSPVVAVPANEAGWDDLQAVLGTRGNASRRQCQRYKLHPGEHFAGFPVEERAHRLRVATDPGCPGAAATTGLVGYRDGVPVGWCAVERGATARVLEGYPITRTDVLLEELHVGTVGMFTAAGFVEVSRPTVRRAVMQLVL